MWPWDLGGRGKTGSFGVITSLLRDTVQAKRCLVYRLFGLGFAKSTAEF